MDQKKVIFMSHAHDDSAQANALKNWLKKNLVGVCEIFDTSDPESVPVGTDWHNLICEKLKQAVVVLCLLSKNSIERNWLYFEAGAAFLRDKKLPVVPICFGGVDKQDLKSLPIQYLKAVEIPNQTEERELFRFIAKEVGLDPSEDHKLPDLELPDFHPSRKSNPYSEWLFSEEELIQHEGTFSGKEIWVVSANLDHDVVGRGPLARIVKRNLLQREISYTYVVPKKPELYRKIARIKDAYEVGKPRPVFKQIETEELDNITETNITVFNPRPSPDDNDDYEVFIELPIAVKASKRCWVKVHKHFSDQIIGRIGPIVDGLKKTPPDEEQAPGES
ncbi:MAG TPA: toll/interleukin-1 receptor domain-containing protein [Pyrinomonadaceae bacterium]|nr:toll/interleukin-1 receptor domain-containing protein [Pyrinomonadaceae bacterium]